LKPISQGQKEYLIKNNILQCVGGKYPDLRIASKEKKSSRKKYFVPDHYIGKIPNNII
jgi:hypothetical protein